MRCRSIKNQPITPLWVYFVACLIVLVSCQRKGLEVNNGDDLDNPNNEFTDVFGEDIEGSIFSNDQVNLGGSGPRGTATPSERSALRDLFNELPVVNPQREVGIPENLRAEITDLLNQQLAGNDVSAQKLSLVGRVIENCAQMIHPFAPRPGSSYEGIWAGSCPQIGPVTFTVRGVYQNTFTRAAHSVSDTRNRGFRRGVGVGAVRFAVSGNHKIQGSLTAGNNGVAVIQAGQWRGSLFDLPVSGEGRLGRSQRGFEQPYCFTTVTLQTPTNANPERASEAFREAGQCLRKAVVLLSPVMDELFKQMDPQIAQLLLTRMLGIKVSR